jgi:formamidopyrimidine-DNA glycosylase
MFNVKSLLELIINEALVSGVYNYYLREQLYTLPNQTIIKEK